MLSCPFKELGTSICVALLSQAALQRSDPTSRIEKTHSHWGHRVSFILCLSQFTSSAKIDNLGYGSAFQTSVICNGKKHLTRLITRFLMLQEINWFYILNCCTHATPPISNAHNYEFLYFKMFHMHKSFHSGPKFHLHDLT